MEEISQNEFISGVGDDVLIEILIRLPDIRSAIQCSAVCKRWRSLISNPQFTRTFVLHQIQQLKRSNGKPFPYSLLFVDKVYGGLQCFHHHNFRSQLSSIDKTLPPINSGYARPNRPIRSFDWEKICAADKDLLLISQPEWHFHVRNPLTGQSLALPALKMTCQLSLWMAGLVCERTRFRVMVIEELWAKGAHYLWEASIFCSETGRWISRGATIASPSSMSYYRTDHVVVNEGILYWLLRKGIAAFDPFKGVDDPALHRHIGLPSGFDTRPVRLRLMGFEFHGNVGLASVRGRLRLSQMFNRRGGGVGLKVWELNCGDRDGWVLVHDDTVLMNKIDAMRNVLLIGFEPGNADAVLLYWKEDIVRYDFVARRHEIVGDFPGLTNESMRFMFANLTLQCPPSPTLIPTLPSIN